MRMITNLKKAETKLKENYFLVLMKIILYREINNLKLLNQGFCELTKGNGQWLDELFQKIEPFSKSNQIILI